MNLDQLVEYISDAIVDEIKGGPGSGWFRENGHVGKQTDSKEFKAWFAKSKVVDNKGNPKIVFHGTFKVFSSFGGDKSDSMDPESSHRYFFTESPGRAGMFVTDESGRSGVNEKPNIMPVYLSIKNPYESKNPTGEIVGDLKSKGYDGIHSGDTWIAFMPTQIKSAIGNKGTFDPKDPDIRKSDSSLNTPNSLSDFSQDRFYSETLGLGRVFQQGSIVEGIKGGAGSGSWNGPDDPRFAHNTTQDDGESLFHGTLSQNVAKIKKEGIKAQWGVMGSGVYASDEKSALSWAVTRWCQKHQKQPEEAGPNVKVAILKLKKEGFSDVGMGDFLSKEDIPPEKILDVKMYRVRDYMPSWKAVDSDLYLGILFDPDKKEKKDISLSLVFKGGVGSGIKGHRTYREVNNQKTKNLQEIAEGKAKRAAVAGAISTTNIKDVIKNMRNEADLYTSYLAPDTAVRMRDFISSYESILYEGTRNKEFKDIQAKDLDDFGIDAVQKMMHQEIESNRLSFTDHGIRHLEGNTQRQLELMDQMGNPTAIEKLSALAIMTNHDMGYTIKEVRDGANPGGGVHQKASGEMFDDQKSTWNENKVFTSKQFDRVSEAIKTHDSTEMSSDNLLTTTRISDNMALFAKEKLPSMFKYVKGGSTDLVEMGKVASSFKKNKDKGLDTAQDVAAFEVLRNNLYKKIDASKMHENLKRDLKAAVSTSNIKTPKFALGVLAGEISSIKGDKKGKATIEIQYSAWDSFLQNHFDMGQKQTKKLLGDYGITDFTKTEYDIGGVVKLKVVGAPTGSGGKKTKEIGLGSIFKGGPGSGNFGHGGRPGQRGGSGSGATQLGSKTPITQDDKDLQSTISQISKMMATNHYIEDYLIGGRIKGIEKIETQGKIFLQSEMKGCYKSDLVVKETSN